jgi:hypothetical protein
VKIVPLCVLVSMTMIMWLLHAAVNDPKPLRLTVKPAVSFAPARLEIQVRLQPDDTDRWISVGMDNGEYRRTSGFTIEPDRVLYTVSWRDVPPGTYDVLAAVGHAELTRASDRARVLISGP